MLKCKTHVRVLIALLAGFGMLAAAGVSQAQAKYPNKPVRILLPYGPGGVADVTMRLIAKELT